MRSLLATLLLLLATAAFGFLAAWQWRQGNFDSVFGAPPTPMGERLYTGFLPSEVKHIRVSANGIAATFELGPNGWRSTTPWTDRMDPRAAMGIIHFALGLRVEDFADADEIPGDVSGLGDTATNIRLEDASRNSLAYFKLGRNTPWKAEIEEREQPEATVYIQPRDKNRKHHVYACTGDINPWFKDGLKFLRDHHPFYFNPLSLGKIRIRTAEGDLTLERKTDESIPRAALLSEIGRRFAIADQDQNQTISESEWLAALGDPKKPAIDPQRFNLTDANRDKQLTTDEFFRLFVGPWRITKPLDLATDPKAVKTLLESLVELRASKLADSAATPLPAGDGSAKTHQISITALGSETETVLDIHPAETPEALSVKATVSDRPGVLFDLPLKPEVGFVALANLPLTINDLRDPILAHLDVSAIRGISIKPATGEEIVVSREPSKPWMAEVSGVKFEANEENLFGLLKAVTTSRVIRFASDAATDFTPWGLNRPALVLRFLAADSQTLELRFGIDGKGGWFANRTGTPTVMEVSQDLINSIAVRPFEWRLSRMWSVDRGNLLGIRHQRDAETPTVLKYKDEDDSWEARRDDKDITAELDPARARYLLDQIEGLKVSRWLAPDDAEALAALKNPALTLTVTEWKLDDQAERQGVIDRCVRFAPAGGANPGFVYGALEGDPNPFLLDRETYQKIAIELFEQRP